MSLTVGDVRPAWGVRAFLVASETDPDREYRVIMGGGYAECRCPSWTNRPDRGWCKHMRVAAAYVNVEGVTPVSATPPFVVTKVPDDASITITVTGPAEVQVR